MFQPPSENIEKDISDFLKESHSINDYSNPLEEDAAQSASNTPKQSRARTPPPALKTAPVQPPIYLPDPVSKKAAVKAVKAVQNAEKEKKENEEAKKKTKLINEIKDFYQLAIKRGKLTKDNLEYDFLPKANHKSVVELEQIKENVKHTLHAGKRKEALYQFIGAGVGVFETVAVNMADKKEFTGISNAYQSKELRTEIDDELEELSIEYGDSLVPGPMVRLGFKMAMFVKCYHDAMSMMANQQPNQKVSNPYSKTTGAEEKKNNNEQQ